MSQRVTEIRQPLHLRRALARLLCIGLGGRRSRPGIPTLALLMKHEDDGQDDQRRHERESGAALHLARQIEDVANRLRGSDDDGDGQTNKQRPILPARDFHGDLKHCSPKPARRKCKTSRSACPFPPLRAVALGPEPL